METTEPEWQAEAKKGPLVSDPMSALCLKAEYAGNANELFMTGIDSLHRRYDAMRRVRGDGNCFFRGFIFALCEQLLSPSTSTGSVASGAPAKLRARIEEKIRASKTELIAIGYSEVAIDAFWETFVDYLAAMETRSLPELYPFTTCLRLQDFQTEGGESEYLVWYARLLTAGHLKKHAEKYQPFVEGLFPGLSVAQFCAAEVEPMGKECDQPQIAALTDALGIGVTIEYLDGSAAELQTYVCLPSDSSTNDSPASSPRTLETGSGAAAATQDPPLAPVMLHLLYRPGHYDILYPRTPSAVPSPTTALNG